MSHPGNGLGGPFTVHCSAFALQTLKRLQERAKAAGHGESNLAALRTVYDRLRTNPLTFGEPLYRLPALKLSIRVGAFSPLVVHFGVHESRPLVILQTVRSLDDPE